MYIVARQVGVKQKLSAFTLASFFIRKLNWRLLSDDAKHVGNVEPSQS